MDTTSLVKSVDRELWDSVQAKMDNILHYYEDMKEKQVTLEHKLDQILLQQSKILSSVNLPLNRPEEPFLEETGKPYTTTIERMSNSKPEIREQANAIRCMQDLGFPVKSSINEVSFCGQAVIYLGTY